MRILMRALKCCSPVFLALTLSACADLFEDYTVSSEVVLQSNDGSAYIVKEERASAWDGSTYMVWTAYNYGSDVMCGQITGDVRTDGGYSYDGVHTLPPNSQVQLAMIGAGSSYYSYEVDQRLWSAGYDGRCYAFSD